MREAFGNVRLVEDPTDPSRLAIDALGLHQSAPLTVLANGSPIDVAALRPHVGKVVQLNALLPLVDGQLNTLTLLPADIQLTRDALEVSPLWCAVLGNINGAPEENPRGDRVSTSIAYSNRDDSTSGSWLKCSARSSSGFNQVLAQVPAKSRLLVVGSLSTYHYDKKSEDRTELEIRALSIIARPQATQLLSEPARPEAGGAFDDQF